jgi:phage terminase large subunit-like protein
MAELIQLIPGYDPYDDINDPITGEPIYYFNEAKAQEAIDFFPDYLSFTRGEWMGTPFYLKDWQKAIIANTFGWLKIKDDLRRYREILLYIPRKNGKTELIGGIGNYVLFCDGEPGAECYTAAGNEEQAMLVWNVAREMIEANPELDQHVRVYKKSIVMDGLSSFFKPITSDAKTKHGFSVHLCLYDELHATQSAELSETIETATGARRQPLVVYMTTADEDRVSVCNDKYDYACKVRDGVLKDPAFLPIIYELTKEEDWHDPDAWKRANPNWGVSVKEDDFIRSYNKAKDDAKFRPAFRRLRLNTVTQRSSKWIDMLQWDNCGVNFDDDFMKSLLKQDCYGGLDLSSTMDTTCLSLFFPKSRAVLQWFWIPEDTARERSRIDKVPYITWGKQGFIEMTPGNRIDNSYIEARVIALSQCYNIKSLAFDPWGATQTAIALAGEGVNMVEFRQGYKSFTEPCKKLEIAIAQKKLKQNKCPVMRWQISNAVVDTNPNDDIKPNKQKASDKIDGVVAVAMAYGVWVVQEKEMTSPYEERGLRVIEFGDEDDYDYNDEEEDKDSYDE